MSDDKRIYVAYNKVFKNDKPVGRAYRYGFFESTSAEGAKAQATESNNRYLSKETKEKYRVVKVKLASANQKKEYDIWRRAVAKRKNK